MHFHFPIFPPNCPYPITSSCQDDKFERKLVFFPAKKMAFLVLNWRLWLTISDFYVNGDGTTFLCDDFRGKMCLVSFKRHHSWLFLAKNLLLHFSEKNNSKCEMHLVILKEYARILFIHVIHQKYRSNGFY